MAIDCIAEIPGAVELSNWFGGFPSFADARAELSLNNPGASFLKIWSHGVDKEGRYDPRRPFLATISFHEISTVSLTDFARTLYLDELDIKKTGSGFRISWQAAYGPEGAVLCERLEISLETKLEST